MYACLSGFQRSSQFIGFGGKSLLPDRWRIGELSFAAYLLVSRSEQSFA
jgi:hypothetical protein